VAEEELHDLLENDGLGNRIFGQSPNHVSVAGKSFLQPTDVIESNVFPLHNKQQRLKRVRKVGRYEY